MKRILLICPFLFAIGTQLFPHTQSYNVVFDLTTGDTATHQRVIRWINSIIADYPDAKIEVVFYGKALPMVETDQSSIGGDVKKLATGKNVLFCGLSASNEDP
jgi:intracellular sulfur oxidation DsrE/DsrF family protein